MALSEWINSRLSELLDFPVPQDLTEYIISIENVRDLEEYLRNLLNFNEPKHRKFFEDLQQKRYSSMGNISADVQGYRKSDVEDVYYQPKQNDKKKKSKIHTNNTENTAVQREPVKIQNQEEKKKKKFVNLYSLDGQMRETVMLRGRHACNCQAAKHPLVGNCLECGRIVCAQEGAGPCFFCGNMVGCGEQRKGKAVHTKDISVPPPDGSTKGDLDAAMRQRNKLLEYDQTSEKRTKVIDDESDYYSSNSVWLSQKERQKRMHLEEEVLAKKHSSRLNQKVTLDFAGRQVLEDTDGVDLEEMTRLLLEEEGFGDSGSFHGPSLHPRVLCDKPVFEDPYGGRGGGGTPGASAREGGERSVWRVQDAQLQEMGDDGSCLSMHQPWASLLVAGIKMHEGRVWYHSHRGRLWVASTARPPMPEEVKQMERTYQLLKGEDVKFPSVYPTSCLLGCVNVVDCLPQEEYRLKFPEGESDSPFVFICEEPKELLIKFPIQGKHKIYKLDKKIHEAASKSLEHVARIRSKQARETEE